MKQDKDVPFTISTGEDKFLQNLLVLKAIGYGIYDETLECALSGEGMDHFCYLQYGESNFREVMRSNGHGGMHFKGINEFLMWYNDEVSPEDKRIKAIDIEIRSLELEKAGLIAKKTGAVC